MNKELDAAISLLIDRVEQGSRELAEKKRTVNSLCREAGKDPHYPDAELSGADGSRVPTIRASQFYGKTPTVAAREYLDLRNDAVPLSEIKDALDRGGFDFAAQGWSEGARLKNLGISMGKNSAIFHRLPNDTWGLLKWYPNVKTTKKGAAKDNGDAETPTGGEETGNEGTAQSADETAVEGKTKTANA